MNLNKDMLIAQMTDNLPTLRTCLNLSQTELAQKIGVSRSTIMKIETKKSYMKWTTFLALHELFLNDTKCCICLSVFGLNSSEVNDFIYFAK